MPLVVDPFAGGGSIPLEALRLGCEAFASDRNPVVCLILKAMLENIARCAHAEFQLTDDEGKEIVVHGLADALRHVGGQIKRAAAKELAEVLSRGPRKCAADGVPLGAHGALLGAGLRGRGSAGSQLLAVQQAQPPAGAAVPDPAALVYRHRAFRPTPLSLLPLGEGPGVRAKRPLILDDLPLPGSCEGSNPTPNGSGGAFCAIGVWPDSRSVANTRWIHMSWTSLATPPSWPSSSTAASTTGLKPARTTSSERSFFQEGGIRAIHFGNHEVLQETEEVLEAIWQPLQQGPHPKPLYDDFGIYPTASCHGRLNGCGSREEI